MNFLLISSRRSRQGRFHGCQSFLNGGNGILSGLGTHQIVGLLTRSTYHDPSLEGRGQS